ncbi:hypothetical protein HQQ80_20515 [Microbacteriaceae bacterium VKM Ac-2855]|nr:hypothetical protein [Microbacteriaceae bacterium VKM Ac-2855]
MKIVRYAGDSLPTGSAVAEALLQHAVRVAAARAVVAVDIPVLDTDGGVRIHTLLLGPNTTLHVYPIADIEDEEGRFPVPPFPSVHARAMAGARDPDFDAAWASPLDL